MDTKQKALEKIIKELLAFLEVSAEIEVSSKEDMSLYVEIKGVDLGFLIGFHGESLNSLQLISSLILYKKTGEWTPITIDVAGYREERNQKILELVEGTAQKVRFLQKPIEMRPMNSYERHLVHETVSKMEGVKSESEGDGLDRRVVIKPL